MNASNAAAEQAETRIHPATRIGYVHYTVADLSRQVEFYKDILGFRLLRRAGGSAALGAGQRELLRLTEVHGARPSRGTTGLYHTAFLVPARGDLAHLIRRIAEAGAPIQGHSNHGTHLAMYLPDAEGNGIELAWDFPKEQWPMRDGVISFEDMPRAGIDIDDLMSKLERDPAPWDGLPDGAQVGHVHLHVADIPASEQFYHAVLGFDVVMNSPQFRALFVSAGGYHHHIGLNTWQGVGAPPPPPDAAGLRYFSIALPDGEELERVLGRVRAAGIKTEKTPDGALFHDPARNGVLLTTS
ncbi:MAG: VOC family protein [Chloroflexi bacterium]|nr:VOC family protein [Chloroflexota bacterium]